MSAALNHEPNDEFQTIEELTAHIVQQQEYLAQLSGKMANADSRIASLKKLQDDLDAQIKLIKSEKTKHESDRLNTARQMRIDEAALEAYKRRLALEAANRAQAEKLATRRGTVDELTANEPWRKRAFQHQLDGAFYLMSARRAICADEMGTGKTLQAVMYLKDLEVMGDSRGHNLVIAPSNLCENFMNEVTKWQPDRVVVNLAGIGTKGALDELEYWTSMAGEDDTLNPTFLINYEILSKSKVVVDELVAQRFDTVICDEAHRMKEVSKATYKAVERIVLSRNICPICGELALPTHPDGLCMEFRHRRVICSAGHGEVDGDRSVVNYMSMTGTIILNRPDEMFASLHLCNDTAFDTITNFRDDYCSKDWNGKYRWSYQGESKLVNKIKGMYLRRTTADAGIVLPPQDIQVHEISIGAHDYPLQKKILKDLKLRAQIQIDNIKEETGKAVDFINMLSLLTRQRQAAVWPGGIYVNDFDEDGLPCRVHIGKDYLESAKLDYAVELYNDYCVEDEQRVVFFSQFTEPLFELKRRLGEDVVVYSGDTPNEIKRMVETNFNRSYLKETGEPRKWKAVLAQYRLGGEGLNLTDATRIIVLDENWSPAMNNQAYKRIQRLGQTEETGVDILRLDKHVVGAVDQWMADLLEDKRKVIDGFEQEITIQQLEDVLKMS